MNIFNWLFVRHNPDLMDLQAYETEVRNQRHNNATIRPPTPIPGIIGSWIAREMQEMRKNRREAYKIYRKYK